MDIWNLLWKWFVVISLTISMMVILGISLSEIAWRYRTKHLRDFSEAERLRKEMGL